MNLLKKEIKKAKRILLSTHLLPDGDGLGAETALFHYLKGAKKSCRVYNPDALPHRYRFLDPEHSFIHDPSADNKITPWKEFDLWIIVDTNDPRRLGALWHDLSQRAKKVVFLDHHPEIEGEHEIDYPKHVALAHDPRSSSIGELLYQLFSQLKLTPLNRKIALGLYVSVMTDTNSFRYARTTPLAHQIAAEMIQIGINPEEIYQSIYSSKQIRHLQLLGQMLQNVKITSSGKVAWLEISLALRQRYRATADDTHSFLNFLLLIQSAEVICLFREEDDGTVRVSMKSKGKVVIHRLAMQLGGGGHEYAAGLALSSSLEKTVQKVIPEVERLVT